MSTLAAGRNDVSFQSMGFRVAGHLYTPEDFNPGKKYPAVVFTSPGTSVKEQAGGVYGPALSKRGYVFLVFDRIGFGESEGPVHQPIAMHYGTEALRDAISFLRTHSFVDRDRFFGLGVCVGSQHIVQTAVTDKRMKAVATISGMLDSYVAFRSLMDEEQRHAYYLAANEMRQHYFETGEMAEVDTIGDGDPSELPERSTQREGLEYYKTPLGGQPTFPNYSPNAPANSAEYEFLNHVTAFGPFLETPYLGIVGEVSDLAALTKNFYDVCTDPKEYLVIPDTSHVDLYYKEGPVQAACDAIDSFFTKHGGAS